MLELAVKTLVAYLLGSLMGALILGAFRGVDIRTQGSGNAGGTNALRTQGKAFALGVIVIDVAKGWFAAAIDAGQIYSRDINDDPDNLARFDQGETQ